MAAGLYKFDLDWAREAGAAWYRSKEPVPIKHPFVGGGYLSNKKWPLNEGSRVTSYTIILDKDHKHFQILSEHLIRSQQVRMETIKPDFIQLLILRLD